MPAARRLRLAFIRASASASSVTATRTVGVDQRVVERRRLRQPSDQGALGQVEFADRLAEIGMRGGLDAIGHVAIIVFVQIEGEDVVFGIAAGDADFP